MANAAIYTRISQDHDDDERRNGKSGTERQEADCRAFCKREGLAVAKVYTDNDISAYSGRTRPAFDELLRDLPNYDTLVYWKTDRLVRRTAQFWKVMEACETAGVRLVSVLDPVDTSSPIGRGVASLLASVGEQESHNTGTRVKRKDAENATNGRPHGHRRAYGYEKDGVSIVRAEAKAIREARDRIFRGESMRSICLDWNERGVKPTTAPAWRVSTFKRMITGTRIAGLRKYQGEAIPGVVGTWPPIISEDDHERLKAILNDERNRPRGRPAAYLLTGIVTCGRCGAVLRSGVRTDGSKKWSCVRVPGDETHCGHLTVKADYVDALVEAAILERLESKQFAKARARSAKQSQGSPTVSLVELENRLVQLGQDYDEGIITRREWLARRGPLEARIVAARDELVPTAALNQFVGTDVRKRWASLSLDAQRSVAKLLINRVIISPKKRGAAPVFDPERVDIDWIV